MERREFKVNDRVITIAQGEYRDEKLFPKGTIGRISYVSKENKGDYLVQAGTKTVIYKGDMIALYNEKSYEDGFAEGMLTAWRLAYQFANSLSYKNEVLGTHYTQYCNKLEFMKDFMPQEVLDKETAYEDKNIHLGDIVISDDERHWRGVVTRESSETEFFVLWQNGTTSCEKVEYLTKVRGEWLDVQKIFSQIEEGGE